MDASKFFTTNAEEWYPNMLECGDCGTETEAGTLADMLQWAMDHSKICDSARYYREFFSKESGWIRHDKSVSSSAMREFDANYARGVYDRTEYRWVKVDK
jgi:hypothetical protein